VPEFHSAKRWRVSVRVREGRRLDQRRLRMPSDENELLGNLYRGSTAFTHLFPLRTRVSSRALFFIWSAEQRCATLALLETPLSNRLRYRRTVDSRLFYRAHAYEPLP